MRRGRRTPLLLAAVLAAVLVVGVAAGVVVGRVTAPASSDSSTSTARGGPSAVDIGFSQDMAVHHQQALLMATLAQTRARPAVRSIAEAILGGQSQELGAFRGWLRLWGEPAVDPHPMMWMANAPMSSHSMPGMATAQQLTHLAMRQGRSFDVLFLQLMIRHHQGGILMADDARRHATLAPVRAAAAAVIAEQTEDLATMRALLRADGGRQLPAPG